MKNKHSLVWCMSACIMVMFFVVSGCGKKGPPLPPEIKGRQIASPYDLKLTPGNKMITLSWKHQTNDETASVKPDGFEVFMAKKTFEACEGCPFVFKSIGYVPIPSMDFNIPVEKGFKYYFRVQATGEGNMKSEYSKTVLFEYE